MGTAKARVRREVAELDALGPIPDSSADEAVIASHGDCLLRIQRPVSDEEAALLVHVFGPDDCYRMAWTLLHLIESAPGGIPLTTKPSDTDNEWLRRLWDRSHR